MNELLWFLMMILNFGAILLAYRLFGVIGLFIWLPIAGIVANIQVLKEVTIFGIPATLGNIVYATSFLVTDILSENYGKKFARRAVFIGLFSIVIMTILMNVAVLFNPNDKDWAGPALKDIFFLAVPRMTFASIIAYAVSQLHDIWAYSFWKKRKPQKKFIWMRNNFSTIVSQLIDSIIFVGIAFIGSKPFKEIFILFISTYIFKVMVAAADTPLVYLARTWKDKGKIKGFNAENALI